MLLKMWLHVKKVNYAMKGGISFKKVVNFVSGLEIYHML
jgi:hypothetical protein